MTRGLVAALLLAANFTFSGARASEPALPVVASFSILADMVAEVGGDRVAVHSLLGIGQDPHLYRPNPGDIRRLAGARATFVNGAGFEGWIDRLIRASGFSGRLIVVTRGLDLRPQAPITGETEARDHRSRHPDHATGHATGHATDSGTDQVGAPDPHAWHDPTLAVGYVDRIEAGLTEVDPEGASHYQTRAGRYRARIRALEVHLRTLLARLPPGGRRIVTPHAGFAYLGHAFGLQILPLTSSGARGETSGAGLARMIRMIRGHSANAIFTESVSNLRLMRQLARETGSRLGGELYSESLSRADGPAPGYILLMQHNIETIVDALLPTTPGGVR